MLQSMTGFGQGQAEEEGVQIQVEVKALNSKNLDLNIRLPKIFSDQEATLRKSLSQRLVRGKVNLVAEIQYTDAQQVQKPLNRELLKAYYRDIEPVSDELGLSKEGLLPTLLSFSDVYQQPADPRSEVNHQLLEQATEKAVAQLEEFRKQEGKNLAADLHRIGKGLQEQKSRIAQQAQARMTTIRSRLWDSLQQNLPKEAQDQVNDQRFEQEVLYYLEKIDITEELDRLDSHLQYFFDNLNRAEAGRRLNFISQELGREINTIGSKISDSTIQQEVVSMKEYLEQIKEQVQNTL
jgi:uncharacterized protein (TIGR00255 family)